MTVYPSEASLAKTLPRVELAAVRGGVAFELSFFVVDDAVWEVRMGAGMPGWPYVYLPT